MGTELTGLQIKRFCEENKINFSTMKYILLPSDFDKITDLDYHHLKQLLPANPAEGNYKVVYENILKCLKNTEKLVEIINFISTVAQPRTTECYDNQIKNLLDKYFSGSQSFINEYFGLTVVVSLERNSVIQKMPDEIIARMYERLEENIRENSVPNIRKQRDAMERDTCLIKSLLFYAVSSRTRRMYAKESDFILEQIKAMELPMHFWGDLLGLNVDKIDSSVGEIGHLTFSQGDRFLISECLNTIPDRFKKDLILLKPLAAEMLRESLMKNE